MKLGEIDSCFPISQGTRSLRDGPEGWERFRKADYKGTVVPNLFSAYTK